MTRVISIVVNYNSGPFLYKCVKALQASKLPDGVEHVISIVDNASSDESLDSIAKEGAEEVVIHRNKKNIGFSAANNQGFDGLLWDYYVCVNPDCQVSEYTITKMINAMESDSSVAVASCVIFNSDGTVQKTCKRKFPTPGSALVRVLGLSRLDRGMFRDFDLGVKSEREILHGEKFEYVEAISGAFFVIKKGTIEQLGKLDEGYFMHCEDLDYCMRARLAGYQVGFLPDASVVHSKGESSKGERLRVLWYLHKGMARFYRKFYQDKYPLIITAVVYLGIGIRFVAKCAQSVVLRLVSSPRPVNG